MVPTDTVRTHLPPTIHRASEIARARNYFVPFSYARIGRSGMCLVRWRARPLQLPILPATARSDTDGDTAVGATRSVPRKFGNAIEQRPYINNIMYYYNAEDASSYCYTVTIIVYKLL